MIRIGSVEFLNALPLVHSLDRHADLQLIRKVPADLLADLEDGRVDLALCPVIDAQTSSHDLEIVPVGAIGSTSAAMTVRLFSRVPLDRIETLHTDGDSHTSVALAQVILRRRHGIRPELRSLGDPSALSTRSDVSAALLIGDKVITRTPDPAAFPFQLDLGEGWRRLTGLPFVFATWLTRAGTDLGSLPHRLRTVLQANQADLETLVAEHAGRFGWPPDQALIYLRDILLYEVGPDQLEAIRRFWSECSDLGLIGPCRTIPVLDPHPA